MTTYRYTGFSTDDFAEATLSIQSAAELPEFDYVVNWREPGGLFNVSFDIDAYDIVLGGTSVKAPDPYLDTYVVQYDWSGGTTYVLLLEDARTGDDHAFLLGGDLFDVSDAATFWPQLTAGTASNPLPGTGFAVGEAPDLVDLPELEVTENDYIIGTPEADMISGGIGDDTIKGRTGDDTLHGGPGTDLVDGGGGDDTVLGDEDDDRLLGSYGNDTLDGGAGADTLIGGPGSDTYLIDPEDTVIESHNLDGTDRIVAGFDYALVGHFEELELTGDGDFRAIGNDLDNLLIGNSGDNLLDAGPGADTMEGGAGDDSYYLRDPGDVITEQRYHGFDTVYTWIGAQAPAQVEALILKSTEAADLSGNELSNLLYGNMAANVLRGGRGNDTLIGLGGDDTLVGGDGRDTLSGGDGSDTYLLLGRSYYDRDTVRESAGHSGIDHVITEDDINLRSEHVENISVVGEGYYVDVYANDLDNRIRGHSGRDYIRGEGGDDWISGGESGDSLYGDAGRDTLLGGAGDDVLNGGAGADHLSGGAGNDTYYVDDIGDRVVEGADGGTDRLYSYIDANLADALEDLSLIGPGDLVGNGNAKDNRIYGNQGDNLLQGLAGDDTISGNNGDDTLRGGAGDDTLSGGLGNDTYFIEDAGDLVRGEYYWSRSYGTADTAIASVSVSFDSSSDIENIRLVGSGDTDAIRYDYGRYAGELRGNSGDNVLDGSGRALDTMLGGQGDDVYVVENRGDIVIEGADAGDDIVRSAVDYALTAHVERLKLIGPSSINGFGNGLDNVIVGNAGNNRLAGREGSDTLTGGAGADSFIFDRELGPDNVDTITDLSSANDSIVLRSSVFAGLDAGSLDAGALRGGTEAQDADDRIIYDRATGELFYDADGAGGADQVLFAVLENRTLLSADVFEIV